LYFIIIFTKVETMIQSMTGFANAVFNFRDTTYQIELKSLNSKTNDINYRSCSLFRGLEIQAKTILTQKLQRGKIDLVIYPNKSKEESLIVNESVFIEKYKYFDALANQLEAPKTNLFTYLIDHSKDFITVEELTTSEIEAVLQEVSKVCDALIAYRIEEGKTIQNDIVKWISEIETSKNKIITIEPQRIQDKREKIKNYFDELSDKITLDYGRFEQEMIFYIEKLDISEELSRLEHHIALFYQLIKIEEPSGKKITFLTQEIGREINTIGSKSNDHVLQHMVVDMKDYLEKIKEQLGNVL
jgi:uncharacterized protein (TIGR00255 family)